MDDARPLGEAVQRLVATLHPERIYLFGSRARGDAQPGSDYDLLVVVPQSDRPSHQRAQLAYGAMFGVGIPMDILVLTRAEFASQERVVASLPALVLREGRLLYAA